MRSLLFVLCFELAASTSAQYDQLSYRYNYAFIEDSSSLIPLQGEYRVEYLTRGQWWSYMDPRTPVDYPGVPKVLKPVIKVSGAPLMVVEIERNYNTPDNKLRVVRGTDTMIVDLNASGKLEAGMIIRTDKLGVPPRPPLLLPFRTGWFNDGDLIFEPATIANTDRFDSLWAAHRTEVLALYDTARYEFTLMSDGLRTGPLDIQIQRDLNYARHLVQFPASGPGTWFELYRQDSLGVASDTMILRVDMPADGETAKWVDITELPYGRYTTFLKWGDVQSLFCLTFGW